MYSLVTFRKGLIGYIILWSEEALIIDTMKKQRRKRRIMVNDVVV